MPAANPNVIILSAPSGAGKTSLARELIARRPNLALAVSHTTRRKRPGETNGVDYHFVNQRQFDRMIKAGDFIEYAQVFGHHYGTSARAVEQLMTRRKHVILQIDWQGARAVRRQFPHTRTVFLMPPSLTALEQRLISRRRDDAAVIKARMRAARSEMSHKDEYDYIVVNDRFEHALRELETIAQAMDAPAAAG